MSSTSPQFRYGDKGEPVMGQQSAFEGSVAQGSTALLRALWKHHRDILEALERQGGGRVVVRP